MLLSGCGAGLVTPASEHPAVGLTITGTVHGGQQPVTGATIMLYAVGTTGYGATATPLLTTSVVTDSNGNFSITGDYSCPTAGTAFGPSTPVYLTARGGNPGLSAGTNNSAIFLMAGLGACNALTPTTQVNINEVSTVAMAWALSPFMSSGGVIGTSSGNALGITNAFATLTNLVDLGSGTSPGATAPANAAIPAAKIYTLADILATCVNSDGTTACSPLFTAATPPGGTTPSNTADAALNVVRNPANNIASLFGQQPPQAPFQPALTSAPADWTLAINLTGGGMVNPAAVSIDAAGYVWISNYADVLTELTPLGAPVVPNGYTGNGFHQSYGMTIDTSNNVWVANEQSPGVNNNHGTITELTTAENVLSGSAGFTDGGLFYPIALSADPNGNIWIVNYNDSSVILYQHPASGIGAVKVAATGKIAFPNAIAVDAGHNAWVTGLNVSTIARISADTSQVTTYSCCNSPDGVAVDQVGNVWATNYFGDSISELSNSGIVLVNGKTGGGLVRPQGIAVDGAGTLWVANSRTLAGGLSELSGSASTAPGTPLSPNGGLGADVGAVEPYAVAIDPSGDVWMSNFGGGFVTEYVGLATPVKTPTVGPPQLP
jgi:hypothetical protein